VRHLRRVRPLKPIDLELIPVLLAKLVLPTQLNIKLFVLKIQDSILIPVNRLI
jgi:hypothetical protein